MIRLVGGVLAEQHSEWTESRRCLALEVLRQARLSVVNGASDSPTKEVTAQPTAPAIST